MSDRILVGTRKGLFIFKKRDGSKAFDIVQSHFLGAIVTMVLEDPRDGMIYAALDHGHFGAKLHRSRDNGQTFEECGVPVYPEKPADFVDDNPNSQKPIEWKLKTIWALEAGHKTDPGTLWCGTLPGGLFKSTDHGSTWTINRPLWDEPRRKNWFGGGADLPGLHSIAVHPKSKRQLTVGVSCGGIWATEDGGKTWEVRSEGMFATYMPPERARDADIQDPHRLVQCRANPDRLWVQHHNAAYRSDDAGRHWAEVSVLPSHFGFAVAVHPKDPDVAWFIPEIKDECRIPVDARLVVSRTVDGGKTFEVLSKGLPETSAYDIVWRHGFDVDRTGKRLVFGSTTGNLFFSKNQGDSWACLSHHLPPVYVVRFAS